MGLMRFTLPPDRIPPLLLPHVYLTGLDRVPWWVQTRLEGNQLVLERAVNDSGNLCLPWPVEGLGRLALSTATLLEREEPYALPLELARGKLSQVSNQLADWEIQGLETPPDLPEKLRTATRRLVQAVVGRHDVEPARLAAEETLRLAVDAARQLTDCYVQQALAVRRRSAGPLTSLLGANLGHAPLEAPTTEPYLQAFNAACVPLVWREVQCGEGQLDWSVSDQQIEWCRAQGLRVCAGPLLLLDDHSLPDWLYMCEGDFETIRAFASEFVEAAVRRYRGKVHLWIAAGRVNTAEILSLSEEEKVRLAARAVELIHALDSQAELLLSFDQPWGEYLTQRPNDLPPLHFADALVRAGLGVSGLMLELNLGYTHGGSVPRDALELSRLLDYWSILGTPLYVALTLPSAAHPDLLAQRRTALVEGEWSVQSQQNWAAQYLPLMLVKPYLNGVFWNQLRDYEPHAFPHGGLFDLRRQPKPALEQLASFRQAHLR